MATSTKFQQLLATSNLLDERVSSFKKEIENSIPNVKIAPVLSYGDSISGILGLLRFFSTSFQHKERVAGILKLPVALGNIFRDSYGNQTFINREGQVIEEKEMDVEIVKDCITYAIETWGLEVPEGLFNRFNRETVDREYQRARETVLEQTEMSSSTPVASMDLFK